MNHRYLAILLLAMIFSGNSYCQIETRPKIKPPVNQVVRQQTSVGKYVLKLTTDLECKVFIDGKVKGLLKPDSVLQVLLNAGQFLIKAVSTENQMDSYSYIYTVSKEMLNQEELKNIALVEIRNKRIADETAVVIAQEMKKQKIRDDSVANVKVSIAARQKAKTDSINMANAPINKILEDMVFVQGGTFNMGGPDNHIYPRDEIDKPAHPVRVDNFYIGKYEITQKQWLSVMGTYPPNFEQTCDDCPVAGSWDTVQQFIKRLNAITGQNYRLPTESEWEYSARGGIKSKGFTYSGSDVIDNVAWYFYYPIEYSGRHPVGQKMKNELGIYDMTGNVSEWCSDWFQPYKNSKYKIKPNSPMSIPTKIHRGGNWSDNADECFVYCRGCNWPFEDTDGTGFRLVLIDNR